MHRDAYKKMLLDRLARHRDRCSEMVELAKKYATAGDHDGFHEALDLADRYMLRVMAIEGILGLEE